MLALPLLHREEGVAAARGLPGGEVEMLREITNRKLQITNLRNRKRGGPHPKRLPEGEETKEVRGQRSGFRRAK